jgi:uracil-DNA glycosylase
MKDFIGDPEFPIWLIGDSPPEKWMDKLDYPLDMRHPARHNIWTSVADAIQDRLYRHNRLRLDTSRLYIRNASDRPLVVPGVEEQTQKSQKMLKEIIDRYQPEIVLTFGVFAFMTTLLASGETPQKLFKTTKLLGEQFRSRIEHYNDQHVNVIPLLHISIARGRFLESHRDFIGNDATTYSNYFDYVGEKLAELLIAKFLNKPIWIM